MYIINHVYVYSLIIIVCTSSWFTHLFVIFAFAVQQLLSLLHTPQLLILPFHEVTKDPSTAECT